MENIPEEPKINVFKTMREQNYRIVLFSYKNADNDTKAAGFLI